MELQGLLNAIGDMAVQGWQEAMLNASRLQASVDTFWRHLTVIVEPGKFVLRFSKRGAKPRRESENWVGRFNSFLVIPSSLLIKWRSDQQQAVAL